MTNSFAATGSWQLRPLCWHYVGVHIEELSVEVRVAYGTSCESTVAWAMGMLADGDWEVLGAWPRPAVGATFWRGVKEDFDSRGVDKISLVCALDLDAPKLCGSVKVLPPFTRILGCGYVPTASNADVLRAQARRVVRGAASVSAARVALERLLAQEGACRAAVLATDFHEALELFRPFYALGTHYRALVRTGDEHLELLGRSLQRAVRRHGRFPDLAAATSFVADTLARHERRLRDRALSDFDRPLRCTDFPMARQIGRVHGRRASLDGRSP